MPEILTYNTPGNIEKEKTKQSIFRSFFDWFSFQDKFTKLYLITFALIILATPFIINNYLEQKTSAAFSIVNLNPNNLTKLASPVRYTWSCYCIPDKFQVILYRSDWMENGQIKNYYQVWVRGTDQGVWSTDANWRYISNGKTYYGKPASLNRGQYYWAVKSWNGSPFGGSATATFYINSIF